MSVIYGFLIYIYLYIYIYIYIYIYTSLHIKYRQKQKKKITQLPDTSILESTWEYEITKIDKYINKINKTIKQ